jgi:hypothetical protein
MATKATLKSYFETGDSPTQAQFAELIDSLLGIEEELADDLITESAVKALTARQGVILKTLVDSLGLRVDSIESLNETTLGDYLLKVDLGDYLSGKSDTGHTHFAAQVVDLLDLVYTKEEVAELIANSAGSTHTHVIEDVQGLQVALADATNDSTLVDEAVSELEAQIQTKSDSGHGHTEADISDLKNYIETATAQVLLQGKSDIGHTHNEASIVDLDKYTKAEVDSLFAGVVSDGSVPAHTHTEANISDLDKYTKAEVDQKVADSQSTILNPHLAAINPHSITKQTIGLGNVENLSKAEINTDAQLVNPTLSGTITGITGSAVGLDQVPNVNVLELLNAHIADTDNPHEVETSDLDIYNRSEADARIEELLAVFRTVHIGTLPEEGTGSTGLITQKDIWDRIKDINFDPNSNTTTLEGNVETTGNITTSGQIQDSDGSLVLKGKTEDGSGEDYDVSIEDKLSVSGDTTIGTDDSVADLTVHGDITINNNIESSEGDLVLKGTADGATTNKVQVDDDFDVTGGMTIQGGVTATGGNLTLQALADVDDDPNTPENEASDYKVEVNDDLFVTGNITGLGNLTIGEAGADIDVLINGDAVVTGSLSIQGNQTSVAATNLAVADQTIVLNKAPDPQPASFTITVGNSVLTAFMTGTLATTATALEVRNTASATYEWKLDGTNLVIEMGGTQRTLAQIALAPENTAIASELEVELTIGTGTENAPVGNSSSITEISEYIDEIIEEAIAPGTQSGIEIDRGTLSNVSLFYDESSGRWKAQIVRAPTAAELAADSTLTEVIDTKTIAFVEDTYAGS